MRRFNACICYQRFPVAHLFKVWEFGNTFYGLMRGHWGWGGGGTATGKSEGGSGVIFCAQAVSCSIGILIVFFPNMKHLSQK